MFLAQGDRLLGSLQSHWHVLAQAIKKRGKRQGEGQGVWMLTCPGRDQHLLLLCPSKLGLAEEPARQHGIDLDMHTGLDAVGIGEAVVAIAVVETDGPIEPVYSGRAVAEIKADNSLHGERLQQ